MTAVIDEENTTVVDDDEDTDGDEASKPGRKQDRDFTKFTDKHKELADFVNEHSGLSEKITPNLVKAVQLLRTDFNDTPEQAAKREERKAAREAEKAKYAGMTPEQIKVEKAAQREEKQIAKLQARIAEAEAKAKAIREGKEGDGESLAAAVEADQAETEDKPKRGIRRK